MNEQDRNEARRLAQTFDARTETSEDIIDAATLLSRLAGPPEMSEGLKAAFDRLPECGVMPDGRCHQCGGGCMWYGIPWDWRAKVARLRHLDGILSHPDTHIESLREAQREKAAIYAGLDF